MKTSTARANNWRCPECDDETSRDESGKGYVRHMTNPNCNFERGERDRLDLTERKTPPELPVRGDGSSKQIQNVGKQGIETGSFGEWLSASIADFGKGDELSVYYDHGDSARENVVATKGFVGEVVSNRNRLADVDVMVVGPNDTVHILIEIEERQASPKKILGDVMAILLCNHFAVRLHGIQRYFRPVPATSLLIVGTVPTRGHRLEKIEEIITPQVHRLSGLPDGVSPQRVELIFDGTIEKAIAKLTDRVRDLLS